MARRAKKGDDGIVIPNDPKKVFDEHFPQIRAAKVDLEAKQAEAKALNGTYRNLLKAYKKAGGDPDALTTAMALGKKEPADIDREFRNLNAALLWIGVEVGTQLGLFDSGKSVAAAVEDEQIIPADKSLAKCEADGYVAGKSESVIENPFEDGSPAFARWQTGFAKAHDELVAAVSKKPRNGAAHAAH